MAKQKLKTHKATAKRFKQTGSGKFQHYKARFTTVRRHSPGRAVRAADKPALIAKSERRRLKRLLPYGKR
ncbi:MAG: 50S ribosomal protein L35 [Ktedonobacteraceae bacterium]|nr:50S ribosomal protein L35 [Ktedonobacteraceae bacterium]